ncbi:MAG: YfhO family protein [Chloroflexota bacterium]|nr:YfhO family protein [Chloroflexota bacterium]
MVTIASPPCQNLATRLRSLAAVPSIGDAAGIAGLLAATAVATRPLLAGGTMVGQDTAAFFYPIFSALGDRLAAGDLPGWNPHQFAGVPFAADPESGWMYLPAMLLFTALPVSVAAPLWLLFHYLLAGLGTYALGRVLGLGALGALTAALAYEFSGLFYARTVCCPAYGQVAAWLPLLLLAAELAMRARRWRERAAWWAVAALALGHVFVAWLGQGAYYVLLAFGLFVLYRASVPAAGELAKISRRFGLVVLHGGVPVLLGLGLAAAAILPRLAYHARTNLAEGYTGDLAWAAVLGGWAPDTTVGELLGTTFYYAGGGVLALAVAALVLARTRLRAPFFALLAAGAVVLAQREATWLHRPLYALLPRFEELHRHWPERDMVVFYLGPAMLAGAAVHALGRWRGRPWLLSALGVSTVALVLALDAGLAPIGPLPLRAAFVVAVGLLVVARAPGWGRRLVPPLLALTLFVDLFAVGRYNLDHGLYGGFHRVDLDAFYAPPGAAAFLREQAAADGVPSRYFGYDPGVHPGGETPPLYRYAFADPRAAALLLNNRATVLGLHDVQGYNPIQPQRYVDYMRALNGFAQEYHEANVYPSGLHSPLLDLLSARYVVVPAATPPGRLDLDGLVASLPTVHLDEAVRVLENREALPRAWVVHEAEQASATEALARLASGAVDPRRTALVEASVPDLAVPADPSRNEVRFERFDADHLGLRVWTDAAGLLVLSETIDPDWRATVDGRPAPVLNTNALFRAVPVPAGEHVVELRYDSPTLRAGTAVSAISYGGVLVAWGAALVGRWRGPAAGTPSTSRLRLGPGRRRPGARGRIRHAASRTSYRRI